MPDFVVTGKKGNGKSLSMIDLIRRHVCEGRRVATNLDLYLEHLFDHQRSDCNIIRVPDLPSSQDLELIGIGNESLNEDMNGALILDELAISMNARGYQDKDRQALLNWMILARKKGWDIYYLIQDISMIDKQVREGLAEHVVYCRRMDRVQIPFLGTIWKIFTGCKMRLPRFHIATVKYGTGPNAPLADRWQYRGDKYFKAYNTRQQFRADYVHGVYTYLPPKILTYRSFSQRTARFFMRLTKIYFRQWSKPICFGLGVALSCASFFYLTYEPEIIKTQIVSNEISDKEKELFDDLKIVSRLQLPGQRPIYYMEGPNGRFSNDDLMDRGFSFSVASHKHLKFSKGDYHADVFSN